MAGNFGSGNLAGFSVPGQDELLTLVGQLLRRVAEQVVTTIAVSTTVKSILFIANDVFCFAYSLIGFWLLRYRLSRYYFFVKILKNLFQVGSRSSVFIASIARFSSTHFFSSSFRAIFLALLKTSRDSLYLRRQRAKNP